MRTLLTLVLFVSTSACAGGEIEDTDGATLCASLEGWEGRHVRLTGRVDPDDVALLSTTIQYCEPGECCNDGWFLYRVPGCEEVVLVAEDALPIEIIPRRRQRLVCLARTECPVCPNPNLEEVVGRLRRREHVDGLSSADAGPWVFVVDAEPIDGGSSRD